MFGILIKKIKPNYKTKKELKEDIDVTELLYMLSKDKVQELKEDNISKDEKIKKLIKEREELKAEIEDKQRSIDVIIESRNRLTDTNKDLDKELRKINDEKAELEYDNEVLKAKSKELEIEVNKIKTKADRQEKRALKLQVKLSEAQEINSNLVRRVTVSGIAKQQLRELCRYNQNNNKEHDKTHRPEVLVNKTVSGVKVWNLANLM